MPPLEYAEIKEEKGRVLQQLPPGVALGITKIDGAFALAALIQSEFVEEDLAVVRAKVEAVLATARCGSTIEVLRGARALVADEKPVQMAEAETEPSL